MNKKAQGMPLNIIIIALIVITAAIVLIAVFLGLFKKEGSEIENKINGIQDCDGDNVANMFDGCPCADDKTDAKECPGKEKLKSCEKGKTPVCIPK